MTFWQRGRNRELEGLGENDLIPYPSLYRYIACGRSRGIGKVIRDNNFPILPIHHLLKTQFSGVNACT